MHSVSPLASIIKFVSRRRLGESASDSVTYLVNNLDVELTAHERAQKAAWCAHIESQIGDLLGHAMYSMDVNWRELVHPTLASVLSIPQRYYVPGRIREAYKPRLEASELWDVPGEEAEEKPKFGEKKKEEPKEHQFKRVFQRERVLDKARDCLDIYARLLGQKRFFFHDRPTTLDVVLASHILLLVNPPYPDPLLKSLVTDSYPELASHARSVYSIAFPSSESYPALASHEQSPLRALIPSFKFPTRSSIARPEVAVEHGGVDILTWGWIALAAVGTVGFWFLNRPSRSLLYVDPEAEEEEGEELLDADEDDG